MDNANHTETQTIEQTSSPTSATPVAKPVSGQAVSKKRGQISVNKAFIIIYAFVLLIIFVGPLLSTGDETILGPMALLVSGGIFLIVILVMIHIFLLWHENKKNK